jgi:hypothetical protein
MGVLEGGRCNTNRIWAPGGLATAPAEERETVECAGASESDWGNRHELLGLEGITRKKFKIRTNHDDDNVVDD